MHEAMDTVARPDAVPPPLPTERRAEPRTRCRVAVVLELRGHRVDAIARDVSVSGAFVECSRACAEGQRLRLRFPVIGLPTPISAEVRWVLRGPGGNVAGAGVRFDSMGARDMATWIRFLRSLA
jgi:PilZ domain-containing protein